MLNGKVFKLGGAIVVNDDFSVLFSSENFFAFSGSGKVSQSSFAQLQTSSIKSIGTVYVDSTSDVIHVVENEWPTIEEHRTGR